MSDDTLLSLEAAAEADDDNKTEQPFGKFQEEAIISIALDQPDFFQSVSQFIKPDMFVRLETKYVMAELLN